MKIVLHIGTEKTGTTTLQQFLFLNRSALAGHGILYPRAFGERNHFFLACYAEDTPWRLFSQFTQARSDGERATLREGWKAAFDKELSARSYSQVWLSNEHLHSHLQNAERVTAVRDLLRRHAREVKVLVYFRRQDQMAVSRYSTALKAGRLPREHFDIGGLWPYQHLRAYRLWAECFGEENVMARRFGKEHFVEGNLLADFCDAVGMPIAPSDRRQPENLNESLSADAEALVIAMNEKLGDGSLDLLPQQRRRLVGEIAAEFRGAPRRPARREAEAFYANFRADNDCLAQCAGWEREPFSEDFSGYPEQAEGDFSERLAWARKRLPELLERSWLHEGSRVGGDR